MKKGGHYNVAARAQGVVPIVWAQRNDYHIRHVTYWPKPMRTTVTQTLCVALTLIACALALPAAAQSPGAKIAFQRKLPPVDEGGSDASWVQFRGWLQEVLRREDRKALASIIDANILNPLEAPRGVATFSKLWDLEGTDQRLIRDLTWMLQLGSAWYQPKGGTRMLCAPYVPIKWPLDHVDPYNNGVIVAKDTPVKDAPSHDGQTLGRLEHDIVAVRDWEVADRDHQLQQRWVRIRHGTRDGFVADEHIRSAIEYRACFSKAGSGWRLMEYVIGIEYLGG